ncbi:MAG: helicase-related protein, partial [Pseudonocardiaceae bacterium]
ELTERGFAAAAVHGDLGQGAREQALRAFRSEKVDVLVATDVAARGIDIPEVTHVINYQCPEDEKTYVHRIGRTGRAGRAGVAITLVDWDEEQRWKLISDTLGLDIPQPAETYSTSEHLFDDLDIPADCTGRLPMARRTRAGLAAEPSDEESRPRRRRGADAGRRTRSAVAEEEAAPVAQPRRRRRHRTRGGVSTGSAAEAVPASVPPAGEDAGTRPRRRRRRSRGTGTGQHGSQSGAGE